MEQERYQEGLLRNLVVVGFTIAYLLVVAGVVAYLVFLPVIVTNSLIDPGAAVRGRVEWEAASSRSEEGVEVKRGVLLLPMHRLEVEEGVVDSESRLRVRSELRWGRVVGLAVLLAGPVGVVWGWKRRRRGEIRK